MFSTAGQATWPVGAVKNDNLNYNYTYNYTRVEFNATHFKLRRNFTSLKL